MTKKLQMSEKKPDTLKGKNYFHNNDIKLLEFRSIEIGKLSELQIFLANTDFNGLFINIPNDVFGIDLCYCDVS